MCACVGQCVCVCVGGGGVKYTSRGACGAVWADDCEHTHKKGGMAAGGAKAGQQHRQPPTLLIYPMPHSPLQRSFRRQVEEMMAVSPAFPHSSHAQRVPNKSRSREQRHGCSLAIAPQMPAMPGSVLQSLCGLLLGTPWCPPSDNTVVFFHTKTSFKFQNPRGTHELGFD